MNATTVIVIEFKIGSRIFDSASCWQAASYARDLQDFHAESYGRQIVPILCATEASSGLTDTRDMQGNDQVVARLIKTNAASLGHYLGTLQYSDSRHLDDTIDPRRWLESPYRPTPSIVEAATLLYDRNEVRELSHRHAHNLDQTTEVILRSIESAREFGRRTICFVTGIPGAGKTLAGLNIVHDPQLKNHENTPAGVFLSGNGPLVKIIQEAIVKDQISKGRTKTDCRHEVRTFIQNVHGFLRYYLEDRPDQAPHENVVVFDEAQRAWDSTQMNRKRGIRASEAALLLEVMERLPNWSAVVALVGGGQEIYLGEAGLEEWGRALQCRPVPWQVVASPEVLIGGESVAGHTLFEGSIPGNLSFINQPLAHLEVVVRNHRAQRWTEWVNDLLSFRLDSARSLFPESIDFPCYVTHDLSAAREWLKLHHQLSPEDRIGLVASSMDRRLRAEGIERSTGFLSRYPFEKWFLEPSNDVRSSYALEVAASEFECQGLELDWVGICWGLDLTPAPDGHSWEPRKFRGARWLNVRQESERAFALNRYRVLLTRARKGLVIFVPLGDPEDSTREPARYKRVYDALRRAGVPELPKDSLREQVLGD